MKGENMTTKKHILIIFSICFTVFSGFSNSYGKSTNQDSSLFNKLQWRNIGPANMGGRTVDIDVVEKSPWIIYAAIGPSGVWKSDNNGITWAPVFEKENTVSVGDIAVCQTQPDIVWVGTGEATARNSVTIGDGVYKSQDGGKTWEHKGLTETRHISRIIPHPQHPDTAFVAAQGHLWGPNEERGVYKTMDGGETWTKLLYINPHTGIADLAIDPENGDILYAAAWDYQRFPFYFYSGGPGSGLYRTMDGGVHWEKLVKDLPAGTLGRIGIAVSRSNPDVVYALIEHEDAGIWRSRDKGDSWERMCDNTTYTQINFRPFYYSQIRIDPTDENVVYVFSGGSFVSQDGGKKFRLISAGTHPDHHALWIDPRNPAHLIDGNDGGIDISYDAGKTWWGIENMALAEVYQIGYDMRNPYHVTCGLQDNGVWGGPSATLDVVGITNQDWYVLGGGDGFYCQPHPSEPDIVYGNSQMNGLYRFDHRLKLSKNIKPLAPVNEPPFRFNWNSPVNISPHEPDTLYTGGNYLFRSTDRGHSWSRISPDLTTNDPEKLKNSGGMITPDNTGAEIHCTIFTIAESPITPGLIWCGTDDGNVQVTRDGGESWTNVVSHIPGLPQNTWCSRIEASRFDVGTAFAVFDGHRNDDYNTYVYMTTDYGKTWSDISGNLPFGWVHVIRQDTRNPDLLYVGTEFSIFATWDRGKSWFDLKNNLPTVAVRDVAVHPRDNDLIIGTHGRGIWILDDISVLQEFTPDTQDDSLYLFSIRPVTRFFLGSSQETFTRKAFSAKNPPFGMNISVYSSEKPSEKPQILIKNSQGETVYETSLPIRKGLQQITWNLQYFPRGENGESLKGSGMLLVSPPLVPPGEYNVELSLGDRTLSQKALIRPDPRYPWVPEDYAFQVASQVQALKLSRKLGLAVTAARGLRSSLEKIKKNLAAQPDIPEEVQAALKAFEGSLRPVEQEILPQRFGYRLDVESTLRGGNLAMRMAYLGLSLATFPSAPTEGDLLQLQGLSDIVATKVAALNALLQEDVSTFNAVLERNGLPLLQTSASVRF